MTNEAGPAFADAGEVGKVEQAGIGRLNVPRAEWSEEMQVGYPLIDMQHRRLFELAASFKGDGDQIRVMKTLAMLCDYVKTHLVEEEELMAACRYPGLEQHKLQHAEFRGMLIRLINNARSMSLDAIAEEVHYLINGWFYHHILTVDFDYVPYLKQSRMA